VKVQRVLVLVIGLVLLAGRTSFAQQQKPTTPPAPQGPVPSGVAPAPQQKAPPTIQVTTGLVHLVATVTDRHHDLVTDLDENDFKVAEDGVPQQIKFFGRETDLPLRIALLLDTSNSIRERLEFEQDAAIDFLYSVIRHNQDDRAFLMTFDNEPEVIQDYTGDLDLLSKAIRAQRAGGGTALNDAIVLASQKLLNSPPPTGKDTDVRRVMVLISDGDDNLSDHALSDAVEAAIRAEASIYCISTSTEWLSVDTGTPRKYHLEAGDKVLEEFADQSGGRVFFPYKVEDLAQSFLDIGDELRSQYFIAYAPSNPATNGKYRVIDVTTDRKGLTVRTRKGYYSTTAAAPVFAPPPGS